MDSNQFSILDRKLNTIIGLLTLNYTKDQTLQDRVQLLDLFGLKQKEIATILGKSERNISVNLLRIRKQKKSNDD